MPKSPTEKHAAEIREIGGTPTTATRVKRTTRDIPTDSQKTTLTPRQLELFRLWNRRGCLEDYTLLSESKQRLPS